MPQRRRESKKPSTPDSHSAPEFSTAEKIARLIAIIAVKGLDNEEAARRLLAAGFDAKQIGGLLGVQSEFRQRG
jgi:hypothetical protein